MGNRDFRKREKKKPKQDTKKPAPSPTVFQPQPIVEVIKKGKKKEEWEEEE